MCSDEESVANRNLNEVESSHEHVGTWTPPQQGAEFGDANHDGDRVIDRPSGREDVPEDDGADARPTQDVRPGQLQHRDEASSHELATAELPRVVLEIKNDVQNIKNELHLHNQFDVQELRQLREMDPAAYAMQLRRMERQHEHDLSMERETVFRPGIIASRGQRYGLIVVFAVLVLAGYALYLHEPWIAGVLTAIDLLGLVTVFARPSDDSK